MKCAFAFAIVLGALGCNHEKAADASPAPSAAIASTVASAAPVAAAAAPDSAAPVAVPAAVVAAIPAEEDFEPQAATTITAANASQQLAVLEKEIRK